MAGRLFITVAEVSGDRHAAQLIRSLRGLDPDLIIEGLGGPEMAAAGAIVHRDTVRRAAMGLRGALRAREIFNILRWTAGHFDVNRPDLQIGVDSPSMNFHFAKLARERGIPVLQYVAPQLWAWAPWRMKKLRRRVDRMACVLPFEEEYFRAHGVDATFVGHPLFDELPEDRGPAERPPFAPGAPTVGILPGSRRAEAEKNLPPLLRVAARIQAEFPGASFVIPTTAATDPITRRLIDATTGAGPRLRIEVGLDQFDQMVPRCDLCVTVSGTATLHVAGYGVPMIVVYRVHPLLWNPGGRLLVRTRTFALVNLLARRSPVHPSEENLVPEFVPWYGSDRAVASVAIDLLRHPGKLAEQSRRLRQLVQSLDRPGASLRTAQIALGMIKERAAAAIQERQ